MKLQVLSRKRKIKTSQLQLNKIKNKQLEVLEEEMEDSEEISIKIMINKMIMGKAGRLDFLVVEAEDSMQIEENKVDLGVQEEEGEVQAGDLGILVGEDQVLEIVVVMEEEEGAMVKEEIMEVVDLEAEEVVEVLEIEEDLVEEAVDLVMAEEEVAEEEVLEEEEILIKEEEDMEEEILEIQEIMDLEDVILMNKMETQEDFEKKIILKPKNQSHRIYLSLR